MRNFKILGLMAGTLFLAACGTEKEPDALKDLRWLLGTWQNTSEAGTLTETWQAENATVFTAKSFLVQEGDTLFSEKINLEAREDGLYYIPVVPDQNAGQPVTFKLKSTENGRFVFENPEHDFPQRIIYRQLPPDSLLARIEGKVKGEVTAEDFRMKKIAD